MDDPEKTLRSLLDTIPKERQPDALAAVTRVLEDWASPTPTLTAPALDALARQHPGTWVERTAKAHHPAPEKALPPLPDKAPILLGEGKLKGETTRKFFCRVYAPWFRHGKNLIVHLKKIDGTLYKNITVDISRNGPPEGLGQPNEFKKMQDVIDKNDQKLNELGIINPKDVYKVAGDRPVDEVRALYAAAKRRAERDGTKER